MMNINGKSIYLTEAPFEGEPTMLSTFRSGWNDREWLIDLPIQMSTLKQVHPSHPIPVRIRFFDEQQVEHCFDSKMEFTGCLFLHDKLIGFRCGIVRLLENGDSTKYIGTEFIEIEEKDREAITHYCNTQQAYQVTREKMMRG